MTLRGMKYGFLILLMMVFSGLALPSAARAQASSCNPEIQKIQSNYYSAVRVRNQSITAQVVVRNDSALAMSCFDQAMAVTSAAGQIFSDAMDLSGLSPSLITFAGLEKLKGTLSADYLTPTWLGGKGGFEIPGIGQIPFPGVTSLLIMQINNTVGDTLNAMLSQIVGSVLTNLATTIAGLLTSQLTNILVAMVTAVGLGGMLTALGSSFGINIDLSKWVRIAVDTVLSSLGLSPNGKMLNCPNMATAWSNTLPQGGTVGAGVAGGVPYITANNLFNKVFPPGVGGSMNLKLTNPFNDGVLTQAGNDNATLATPGAIASHPAVPALPPNPTTAAVIGAM